MESLNGTSPQDNPCLFCGACCAFFRASFHWAEADDAGGSVPVALIEDSDSFRRVMRGTNQARPRCVALEGEIGVRVACSIYDLRSSTCREFPPAWENGEANDKCDRARIAWGMPPLPAPNAALHLGAHAAAIRSTTVQADIAAVEDLLAPAIAAAALPRPPCRPRPG